MDASVHLSATHVFSLGIYDFFPTAISRLYWYLNHTYSFSILGSRGGCYSFHVGLAFDYALICKREPDCSQMKIFFESFPMVYNFKVLLLTFIVFRHGLKTHVRLSIR